MYSFGTQRIKFSSEEMVEISDERKGWEVGRFLRKDFLFSDERLLLAFELLVDRI